MQLCENSRELCSTVLEIAFASVQIRSLCERRRLAERRLGQEVARKLRARVADLKAATNLADLVVGMEQMHIQVGENFHIALGSSARIVLRPNHIHLLSDEHGRIARHSIRRVLVVAIEGPII